MKQRLQNKQKASILFYAALPLLGLLFCVWYIRGAACDVVYTDYIRIVDAYLPDVTNPAKFFVADVFTRIPASFLQRLINVRLFGFSVTFDRLCGAAGLFLLAAALAVYAARMRIRAVWFLALSALVFSLNKWEILLNGTAWAHVVSFGLFFLHYDLLDRYYRGERARWIPPALYGLPFVILLFAGEYIAAYAGVMILACLFCMLYRRDVRGESSAQETDRLSGRAEFGGVRADAGFRKRAVLRTQRGKSVYTCQLICVLIVLGIYLLSRHFAVWEHAGATGLGFGEALAKEPLFFPRFFVKSFAGAVIGQETIANFFGSEQALPDGAVLLCGMLVIAAYLAAMAVYVRRRFYEKTLFPMILLLSGGMNHVLVTASRWIFLKESYALSSRYSAQFMIGLCGVLLIFALAGNDSAESKTGKDETKAKRAGAVLFTVFILAGNCYTTYQELQKMPYREQAYETKAEMLLHHADYTDEALCDALEWHKDAAVLHRAIAILEENHLNVFR